MTALVWVVLFFALLAGVIILLIVMGAPRSRDAEAIKKAYPKDHDESIGSTRVDRSKSKAWWLARNVIWLVVVGGIIWGVIFASREAVKSGMRGILPSGPPAGVTLPPSGPNAPILLDPRNHEHGRPAATPSPVSEPTSPDQEADCKVIDPVAGIQACTMHNDKFHGPYYPLNSSAIDLDTPRKDQYLPPEQWSACIMYGENGTTKPNPNDVICMTAKSETFYHYPYHGPVWIRGTEGATINIHPGHVPAP